MPLRSAARGPRSVQRELRAGQATADDIVGAHVRRRPEPERPRSRGGQLAHRGHAPVVGVEDGEPVRGKRRRELGLGRCDALDAPRPLEVRGVDGQHDTDLGLGDLGQARDLPGGVHPHLEHGRLVRRIEAEQGHRQAALGVEVALAAERAQPAGEDVGDDLLGEGLAGRAR